jgi:hypothetical protein
LRPRLEKEDPMPPVKKPAKKTVPRHATPPAPVAEGARVEIAKALTRKPSRKMAREMLILETRRLRAVFSEIAERYVAEMEGRIASVVHAMETKPLPPGKIDAMLKTVRGLTVKPQKGRRKDLARIEKATEALFKALEE